MTAARPAAGSAPAGPSAAQRTTGDAHLALSGGTLVVVTPNGGGAPEEREPADADEVTRVLADLFTIRLPEGARLPEQAPPPPRRGASHPPRRVTAPGHPIPSPAPPATGVPTARGGGRMAMKARTDVLRYPGGPTGGESPGGP